MLTCPFSDEHLGSSSTTALPILTADARDRPGDKLEDVEGARRRLAREFEQDGKMQDSRKLYRPVKIPSMMPGAMQCALIRACVLAWRTLAHLRSCISQPGLTPGSVDRISRRWWRISPHTFVKLTLAPFRNGSQLIVQMQKRLSRSRKPTEACVKYTDDDDDDDNEEASVQ